MNNDYGNDNINEDDKAPTVTSTKAIVNFTSTTWTTTKTTVMSTKQQQQQHQ